MVVSSGAGASPPGGARCPRLALVDWMMPELDGPGLCRAVRSSQREGPYVYILLLTSKQNSEDVFTQGTASFYSKRGSSTLAKKCVLRPRTTHSPRFEPRLHSLACAQ